MAVQAVAAAVMAVAEEGEAAEAAVASLQPPEATDLVAEQVVLGIVAAAAVETEEQAEALEPVVLQVQAVLHTAEALGEAEVILGPEARNMKAATEEKPHFLGLLHGGRAASRLYEVNI